MAWARHGKCESDTAALCKSNGKTHSKPLAARHGMGAVWERHAMCESALMLLVNPEDQGDTIFRNVTNYRYASLNDGDTFGEMRRLTISS